MPSRARPSKARARRLLDAAGWQSYKTADEDGNVTESSREHSGSGEEYLLGRKLKRQHKHALKVSKRLLAKRAEILAKAEEDADNAVLEAADDRNEEQEDE